MYAVRRGRQTNAWNYSGVFVSPLRLVTESNPRFVSFLKVIGQGGTISFTAKMWAWTNQRRAFMGRTYGQLGQGVERVMVLSLLKLGSEPGDHEKRDWN